MKNYVIKGKNIIAMGRLNGNTLQCVSCGALKLFYLPDDYPYPKGRDFLVFGILQENTIDVIEMYAIPTDIGETKIVTFRNMKFILMSPLDIVTIKYGAIDMTILKVNLDGKEIIIHAMDGYDRNIYPVFHVKEITENFAKLMQYTAIQMGGKHEKIKST